MSIPYRTQRVIKRILVSIVVLAVLLAAGSACWLIWVQRYIVYSADGSVRLDFSLPPIQQGILAVPPTEPSVNIYFDRENNNNDVTISTELTQIAGYYVDAAALKDIPTVKSQIQALPYETAVMVDVKNIYGDFFYSSSVSGSRSSQVNTAQMDELIAYLNRGSRYTIARIPALRDYAYGLNHVSNGVHHSSGMYLYQDDQGCYWLHPGKDGTLSYLTQIILELKKLGFDEVVLDDFCFPQTDKIMVNGDKTAFLTSAADVLLSVCATDQFAVSFIKSEEFTMPQGRTRMYLKNVDASEAENAANSSNMANPAVNLVFLTELHDTRFDVYSVLRPLSAAH